MNTSQATKELQSMNSRSLRAWVALRLRGTDYTRYASPLENEDPVDILIALLRPGELPANLRKSIVNAIDDCALNSLSTTVEEYGDPSETAVLKRVLRLLDSCAPPELRERARVLWTAVATARSKHRELIILAARAMLAVGVNKQELDLWQGLLDDEETAAFAVRAISLALPGSNELAIALAQVIRKVRDSGWRTDVAWLLHAATTQPGFDYVRFSGMLREHLDGAEIDLLFDSARSLPQTSPAQQVIKLLRGQPNAWIPSPPLSVSSSAPCTTQDYARWRWPRYSGQGYNTFTQAIPSTPQINGKHIQSYISTFVGHDGIKTTVSIDIPSKTKVQLLGSEFFNQLTNAIESFESQNERSSAALPSLKAS